jgi:imidazolonepropionase
MYASDRDAALPNLLITDIGTLAAVPPGPLAGPAQGDWPLLHDAALLVQDGRIAWFGPAADAPRTQAEMTLSAHGGTVIPGLIDAHTHIPFAGDRSGEFVRRLAGDSYLQILESGGGIRVTATAVADATEEALVEVNRPRLERMAARGVTTVECKSGYGLSPELKQLRAIQALNRSCPIDLVPTYMGAHALPASHASRADAFIDEMSADALLATITRERLAVFADVFCDRGAFTVEQSRRYLQRCRDAGLMLKIHADELAQIGASRLAGELGAVSADHLECLDDAGIEAMRAAGTVAMVLPGTSFFLGIEHADARKMIRAGLPVGVATDFNPGSCHIESLPFVMNIACCQLRLTPKEVLAAVTANAAAALKLEDRRGAIAQGFEADLVILDAPDLDLWFYSPGRDLVRAVMKRGRLIHEA